MTAFSFEHHQSKRSGNSCSRTFVSFSAALNTAALRVLISLFFLGHDSFDIDHDSVVHRIVANHCNGFVKVADLSGCAQGYLDGAAFTALEY